MLSEDTIRGIVGSVSDNVYGGNVIIDYIDSRRTRSDGRVTYRLKLRVADSRGDGARASWSGRRTPSLCWHGFRDVIRAIFAVDPNATILTAMARYEGSEGFESTYPATAYKNIGSMMQPVTMPELCDC